MKDLTSSVYTFEDLIKNNFLYVDKTGYIWELIRPGKAMYFMSRPRRFGKSLTVSTLDAIFHGKRELFKGLAIDAKPYDWKAYPVIYLDFADRRADTPQHLEQSLQEALKESSIRLGVTLTTDNAQSQFRELVLAASKSGEVVILIDEYDKPILGNVANPQANEILKLLKGFFSVIKATASLQRFVFMTGVSKFAHVSVFSDLNNLTDITMAAEYATMLGYTQEELEANFRERIEPVAKRQGIAQTDFLDKMKDWYNGYRFHAKSATVYNPVSIAQFFNRQGEFNNYWFSTGTPTFLLELAKKNQFDFERALTQPVSAIAFDSYEVDNIDPLALLLQTGYLTIKSSFSEFNRELYRLGFPNLEVKSAFDTYLLNHYTSISRENIDTTGMELARLVCAGKVDEFMETLKNFFARIPYGIHVKEEKYYQTIFFMVFMMLGIYIEAESQTGDGRIDAVALSGQWLYIFEFKLDKDAETAISQIKTKEYFRKYSKSGKRIVLIGANFDSEKGQITKWISEELI